MPCFGALPSVAKVVHAADRQPCASMDARPHTSDCGISEHRQILSAIKAGDNKRAVALMAEHLDAMANRALLPRYRTANIRDVLNRYAADEGINSCVMTIRPPSFSRRASQRHGRVDRCRLAIRC